MTRDALLPAILALSCEDRLLLIDEIWDSLPEGQDAEPPLSEAHRAELDRRLDEMEMQPGIGRMWEEVEAAARAKLSRNRP